MSISLLPGATRLTVLGSGWSSTAVESGDGLTEDGKLWEDVAGDLGYEFGDDVDWDEISGSIDWSDSIYTDQYGNIYTDPYGTGVWTNPETGLEYDGSGNLWLTEDQITSVSDALGNTADADADLTQYGIDRTALIGLYGGPVSQEGEIVASGSDRPHKFSPPVFFIQEDYNTAWLFLSEPFYHSTAAGGNVEVYDEAVTIRPGDRRAVYWSSCTTHFTDKYLPPRFSNIPIQYVCWQCLHGSFFDVLVKKTDKTITTDKILGGTSGLETKIHDGIKYYCVG